MIDIAPVCSRADLREFRRLPRLLRGVDPRWVEPLRSERAGLLDRARHPFWVEGEGPPASSSWPATTKPAGLWDGSPPS